MWTRQRKLRLIYPPLDRWSDLEIEVEQEAEVAIIKKEPFVSLAFVKRILEELNIDIHLLPEPRPNTTLNQFVRNKS